MGLVVALSLSVRSNTAKYSQNRTLSATMRLSVPLWGGHSNRHAVPSLIMHRHPYWNCPLIQGVFVSLYDFCSSPRTRALRLLGNFIEFVRSSTEYQGLILQLFSL